MIPFGTSIRKGTASGSASARSAWMLGLCVLVNGAVALPARGTEGGGSQYAIGVETHYPGVILPSGFHTLLYYTHYDASHSKDNNGDDNPRLAYFKIKADSIAGRMSYVYPDATLFGAKIETRVAVAVPTIDANIGIARPAALGPLDRSGSTTSLNDVSLFPMNLGWHGDTYDQLAGLEINFPTGRYDPSRNVNVGRHVYGIAPSYAFTWLPAKNVDVSAKLRYAFTSPNSSTRYHSGNEFTTEFAANYRFDGTFAFGFNGYVYRQITSDTQNGAIVAVDGNKGRVYALGPNMTYNFTRRIAVILKVQREFGARNKSEGTRAWVQFRLPLESIF